jgi:hypothetical protein
MNSKEPVVQGTRLFDRFFDFLRIPDPYPLVLSLKKERKMQHWSAPWHFKLFFPF